MRLPAIVFLLVLSVSCNSSRPSSSSKANGHITLTYWSATNALELDFANQVAAEWNTSHPEVQIKVEPVPSGQSSEEVILAAMASHTTPDIYANIFPGAMQDLLDAQGVVQLVVRGTAVAYWPMEDGDNAQRIASGLSGKPDMAVSGSPEFASFSDFNESNQILKVNSAKLTGPVLGATEDHADVRFLLAAPEDITTNAIVVSLFPTGDFARVDLIYLGGDTWRLNWWFEIHLELSTPSFTAGPFAMSINDKMAHVRITLQAEGSDYRTIVDAVDATGADLGGYSGLIVGATPGRVYQVTVNNAASALMTNVYIGHLAVYGADAPAFTAPVNAWRYETATDRIERICAEETIEYRQVGGESAFLGFQNADSPQAIMSSAAVSDIGYLTDPLDWFGVEYRTGRSLYNQAARLSFSYTGNELSGELRPVDDDSYLTNDFTAQRGDAGSARYRLTEGALSVSPPPDGVGEYADSQSFSLAHEGQCVDLASWFVHQGTLDEEHYNRIEIALENLRIAADPTLIEAILNTDIGHRLDVTDTPSFLPANDIRQLVIGYEEWFDNFQHDFRFNTIAERAFEVAQYDTDYRFDTAGSTIYSDITAAATTMRVVTDLGQPWSTTATDFDVWVDGERMTATTVADDSTNDINDSFNRADNPTSLGSTSSGVVQAWVQNSGTWGIISNTAYISVAGDSIATLAATADFELLDFDVPTWTSGEVWVVFRFTDTSNYLRWGGTVGGLATFEVVSGGVTTRTDASFYTLVQGDELNVRCNGSVIELFVDDLLKLCVSETTQLTATRIGMRTTTTVPRLNNLTYRTPPSPQTFTVTRAVNGVSSAHAAGTEVVLYERPYRGL